MTTVAVKTARMAEDDDDGDEAAATTSTAAEAVDNTGMLASVLGRVAAGFARLERRAEQRATDSGERDAQLLLAMRFSCSSTTARCRRCSFCRLIQRIRGGRKPRRGA